MKKAMALNIPKGQNYGRLKNGLSVTLDDGRCIEPTDCVAPGEDGERILVIDCPSEASVSVVASEASLAMHLVSSTGQILPLACVVHLTPYHVASGAAYKVWAATLPCPKKAQLFTASAVERACTVFGSSQEYITEMRP